MKSVIRGLGADLRDAVRWVRRTPAASVPIVFTLALALAANSITFGFVRGILLKSLPYPNPETLVLVSTHDPSGVEHKPLTNVFGALRTQSTRLHPVAAYEGRDVTVSVQNGVEGFRLAEVSSDFFDTLGVHPSIGRGFGPADEQPGSRIVVIGYRLWERVLQRAHVIGTTLVIEGQARNIVGIMPHGFSFPSEGTELWVPMGLVANGYVRVDTIGSARRTGMLPVGIIGRLRTDLQSAKAETATLFSRFTFEKPLRITVVSLLDAIVGNVRLLLWLSQAAVLLLLGAAIGNVASILLSVSAERRTQLAVRLALGASRARLVRTLLLESCVLAMAGCVLGMLITWWAVKFVRVRIPPTLLPRIENVRADEFVWLFTAIVTACSAFAAALAPALDLFAVRSDSVLRSSQPGGLSLRSGRAMNAFRLISGLQTAGAVILLSAALFFSFTLRVVTALDPGFDPTGLLTARIDFSASRHVRVAERVAAQQSIVDMLKVREGTTVGAINELPFSAELGTTTIVKTAGHDAAAPSVVQRRIVSADYFSTLRIRLLKGRFFDGYDTARSTPAALVSEAFVRQYLNGRLPLGDRLDVAGTPHEIIGVVQNVKSSGLLVDDPPTLYQLADQLPTVEDARKPGGWVLPKTHIVIRSESGRMTAQDIRSAVRRVDPGLLVTDVKTMNDRIAAWNARSALAGSIMAFAAFAALLLCAVGVYGATQFNVSRRTRELAIRIVMGARPSQIRALVVSSGLAGLLAGCAIGALGWIWAVRFVRSIATPVPVTAILPWGIATVGVTLLSIVAWYFPSQRAVKAEPAAVLKSE